MSTIYTNLAPLTQLAGQLNVVGTELKPVLLKSDVAYVQALNPQNYSSFSTYIHVTSPIPYQVAIIQASELNLNKPISWSNVEISQVADAYIFEQTTKVLSGDWSFVFQLSPNAAEGFMLIIDSIKTTAGSGGNVGEVARGILWVIIGSAVAMLILVLLLVFLL